jgi:alanine racemase
MGPTKAIIDHDNLRHNYRLIKNLVKPAQVLCVLKANAYGHGSVEISKTLAREGAEFMGVAYPEEGIELRKAGIDLPVLLFGVHFSDTFEKIVAHDIDITLTDLEQLDPLRTISKRLNKKARVHIKIDTGMNRVGFRVEKYKTAVERILSEPMLEVVGIYSHFSSSDEKDLSYTRNQLDQFKSIRSFVTGKYNHKILYHIANSGAIMQLKESYMDLVRPGAMLYGYPPDSNFELKHNIKEVMAFKSKVVLIKQILKGEPVSYSRRFYTEKDTHIAIIPVGYADGYNRRFTNTGQVIIHGKRYPVTGAVCMDQIMVDLGMVTKVTEGDEVVLLGKQNGESITNVELSKKLGTIPYELTCSVSQRVQRIHINNK